jgi:pimeloyl-ACP methyl ester carboxylesterase
MTALGACSAEWWHLAEMWSKKRSVLLYDRGGYGLSEKGERARTPDAIASELKELLNTLDISEIQLLGHSIGGLYAYQFAKLYPEMVRSLTLLDPVSPDNDRLKDELTEEEYRRSGIEKEGNVRILKIFASLGIGFLLKPLLRKAPPFHYYSGFTKEAEKRILANTLQRKTIETIENEYSWLKDPVLMRQLKITPQCLPMPLTLILHTPENLIREIETYGNAPRDTAEKVERIWSNLMREYRIASDDSREIRATNSAHFIHLSDPGCIEKVLTAKPCEAAQE